MLNDKAYQLFFSALPVPALVLEPRANGFFIVEINEAFLKLTSLDKNEVFDKELKEAFPANPAQKNSGHRLLAAALNEAYKTGTPVKLERLRHDLPLGAHGNYIEKYWTSENIPVKDPEGKVIYIIHVSNDVTEEVLAKKKEVEFQTEIHQLSERHHHFIEGNQDAMYSLDSEGNFLSANEGTALLIETPIERLLQMNFSPFCDPADKEKIWAHFQKALEGQPTKFEANFISAFGKKLVLSISLVPMKLGSKAGVYGIAKDYTAVRTSEKVILKKRKFLEVNAAFISALLEKELEHENLQEALANIGKTIGVDRTYYFLRHQENSTGNEVYSLKNEWSSEKVSSQLHNPGMQNIPEEDLDEVLVPLRLNQSFFADYSSISSGPVKDVFREQDIKSMLLYPIFVEKRFSGFVGFDDCSRERLWTRDEITFIRTLAHNLSNALERQKALKEAKQKEEHLDKSQRKFRSLVQEGSDVIGILDCDANFIFKSNNSGKILGFEQDHLIGRNAFDFIHPEDVEGVKKEFSNIESEKQIKLSPFRFRKPDNEWLWLETTVTNLLDDPAVAGIVTNSKNITELINQALEIEQINERYALAAKATEDLIFDWDLTTGQVIRFYESSRAVFGYPSEEVNKKEFWMNNIHPEDREREQQKLENFLADPNVTFVQTKYRFKRADGTYGRVVDKGYVLREKAGKAIRLIGAIRDVSDLVEKEEALILANTRFELAMEATDEIIWDWDIKNDIIIRSAAFEKSYGCGSGETPSIYSFWLRRIAESDRERVKESLSRVLEDKDQTKWREEYCLVRDNGEQAHIIDRAYIVRDGNGDAIRVVGAMMDVTESRRLIKEIRRQNEGLREIAWKQSHEVRAPLARLKGLVDLLKSKDLDDLDRDEILGHIFCSADELDRIIREIVEKTEHIEISHKEGDIESQNSGPVDVV